MAVGRGAAPECQPRKGWSIVCGAYPIMARIRTPSRILVSPDPTVPVKTAESVKGIEVADVEWRSLPEDGTQGCHNLGHPSHSEAPRPVNRRLVEEDEAS